MLFLCIISLASAIPATNDHNALSVKLPTIAGQPRGLNNAVRNRNPRSDRQSRDPIESTWNHVLGQVFSGTDVPQQLSPELKNFIATMGLVNSDPKLTSYINDPKMIYDAFVLSYVEKDQDMFNAVAFSFLEDVKLLKHIKKALPKYFSSEYALLPNDLAYKCMISAIEQGHFEFLKILDGIDFDILKNLIINESGSKLVRLIDIILNSDILDRHSERYAMAYLKILYGKEWEVAKLFLNDRFPLHQKTTKKILDAITPGKKLADKIDPWPLITYVSIRSRKDEKDREFAKEIFLEMKKDLMDGNINVVNSGSRFKLSLLFDAVSLGEIDMALRIFEVLRWEVFQRGGWDADTTKLVSASLNARQTTDSTYLRAALKSTWILIIGLEKEEFPKPKSDILNDFDKSLRSIFEDNNY